VEPTRVVALPPAHSPIAESVLAKPQRSGAPAWVQPERAAQPAAPRWACSPIAEPVTAVRVQPAQAVRSEARRQAEERSAEAQTAAPRLEEQPEMQEIGLPLQQTGSP